MELWWIFSAQVHVESHETLKWLFSHTTIPSIVQNQVAGEPLMQVNFSRLTVLVALQLSGI